MKKKLFVLILCGTFAAQAGVVDTAKLYASNTTAKVKSLLYVHGYAKSEDVVSELKSGKNKSGDTEVYLDENVTLVMGGDNKIKQVIVDAVSKEDADTIKKYAACLVIEEVKSDKAEEGKDVIYNKIVRAGTTAETALHTIKDLLSKDNPTYQDKLKAQNALTFLNEGRWYGTTKKLATTALVTLGAYKLVEMLSNDDFDDEEAE